MHAQPNSPEEQRSDHSRFSRAVVVGRRLGQLRPRRGEEPPTHERPTLSALAADPEAMESPSPKQVARRDAVHRRSLAYADLAAAGLALVLCAHFLGGNYLRWTTLLALPLVVVVSKVIGLYDREEMLLRRSTLDEVPALFQLATLYALLIWLLEPVLMRAELGRWHLLELWVALFVLLAVCRMGARALSSSGAPEECLMIGGADSCAQIREKLSEGRGVNARVAAAVPFKERAVEAEAMAALASPEALGELARGCNAERLILAPHDTDGKHVHNVVKSAKALGLKVSIVPRVLEAVGASVEFDDLHGVTVLGVRRFGLTRSSKAVKRSFDLVGSACGLIVLAPFFAMAALAIRLDSKGPVFFHQLRVGRGGKRFRMRKFRTMVADADERKHELEDDNEADGLFKIADDPRITRVGRILRRSSLDEIPQLINVLLGGMSLVGPRPLIVDEDERVHGFDRRRLALTPGMTGRWQVLGSSRIPMHEMVKLDYLYVANWTLWSDLKILLRTVPYMLARRGM